jgi:acetolactate synthase-1/2/3 large subunit
MPRHANGGDLLVRLLRAAGVHTVFGIVSVHNLPLVDALGRELTFVPVRHEAAAVNAADGYARVSGGLGVAVTSTGTGAGNAAGALVEAESAGSRVLHVTGQIESRYLGQGRGVIHETRDQLGMLAALGGYAATISAAADAEAVLAEAMRHALRPLGGPASVEWPIDLQYAAQSDRPGRPSAGRPDDLPAADPAGIAAAAELLARSARPLIWAGGGARAAGPPLRRLAERVAAPILTSNAGRGCVREDHDLVIGNFATHPAARELIADADLLLSVGTHFRSNETADYQLTMPRAHVQIDLDAAAIGRVYPATVGLRGAAGPTLSALLAALPQAAGERAGWLERGRSTRLLVRERLRAAIGAYAGICDSIRARLPENAVLARDVTIPSSQWGNRLLEVYEPATNVFPLGGGIGQGLAMGLGAALARPDAPTLVLAGDGGLLVHLGELATVAEQRPWLVLVVCNDGGYGVLRNMQRASGWQPRGVDLFTPDLAKLAGAMGLGYGLARDSAGFDALFAGAVAGRAPFLLEVDVAALDPPPAPFVPPVAMPET